jgi:periplasmic divalent cation tolerance protein
MDQVLLVMTNLPDMPAAQALAHTLVDQRLAACVNCLPAVKSVYRWQDAIEEADEVTVFIKTVASRYTELEAAIRLSHPYQLPEIVALSVAAGLPPYLDWVVQETKKDINA